MKCDKCNSKNGKVVKEGLYFTFYCYSCDCPRKDKYPFEVNLRPVENPEEFLREQFESNKQLELPLNDEPKWLKEAKKVAELVQQKQEAYGDSFGKSGRVMRELFPNGISPEQMDDALTIVRVLDKLFRIATKKDAFGESPWKDINGYSLLALTRDEEQKRRK